MQFGAWSYAWFALAIPAIVLLYLFKRNYTDKLISSHLLWDRTLKDSEAIRPWQKLRSRLLLFIQLMIACLLVLALMQPMFPFAKQSAEHVIFVVDRSASMQALLTSDHEVGLHDGKRTYEIAAEQIETWINDRGADFYTLLFTGNPPEIVFQKSDDAASVLRAIHDAEPDYGSVRYGETMELAYALAEKDDEAIVVIVSDGLWSDVPSDWDTDATIDWIPIEADDDPFNLAITRFGVSLVEVDDAEQALATAIVRNTSSEKTEADVSLYGDGQFIERLTVQLGAFSEQSVYFQHLPYAKTYRLQIDTPDMLEADNVSYAFLTQGGNKTIMFVGEPSYFMQQALAVMDVETVYARLGDDGHYVIPQSDYAEIDLIIVESVDVGMMDTAEWKRLLEHKPVWLLDPSSSGETGKKVQLRRNVIGDEIRIVDHPLTQYVRWMESFVSAASTFDSTPWSNMEAIVSMGDVPLVYAGKHNGVPKLMHTFELSDSDFPLRAEFPIWTAQAIDWLSSSQEEHLHESLAGTTRSISFAFDTEVYRWERMEPNEMDPVADMPWETVLTNEVVVPSVPGLYALVERNSSGTVTSQRNIFIYMSDEESDLSHRPVWENWREYSNGATIEQHDGKKSTAYRDFFPLWIAIVMLLLLIEWEVYQRGHSY